MYKKRLIRNANAPVLPCGGRKGRVIDMNSEQIRKFFADYQVVLKRVEQLESAMRTKSDWETWCAALRERADFFHTEYARMNAVMRYASAEFAKDKPDLDDDAWKQLQKSMMDFYRADTHDLALLMEIAKILQKHYGHSSDLAAMTEVDLTLAYTNLEFSRILREPYGMRAKAYYRKIAILSRNFGAIKEHSVHQAIVISYANLIMSCCVLGTVTMVEAFEMWEEMKKLQASEALAATRESEPDVGRLLDIFTERFRTDAYSLAKSFDHTIETHTRYVPPELMSRIEQITAQYYEKLEKPEESTADMFQVIISQCDFDCETGRRTADECWKEIHTFFRKTAPKVGLVGEADVREIDVISYYVTCLDALISFLVETTMPMAEKKRYFREYQQEIREFIADYDTRTGHGFTLNYALEELAFFPNAYALFDTAEEKIDYIFRLVVARHCTTFLHSLMVSAFAEAILSAIIDQQPEMMVGYHGTTSPEDVQERRAEILQFTHDAALLHDVGKNSMLAFIETQHRPLTDDEFGIIRSHPNRGGQYLSIDKDLARYVDIARGHHKFYNGKGGYPNDFDNTASPERFMIDIITVCDCLDAATDQYGRNYHQAKTTDEVLAEFERDAGIRYNPDIVRFITQNPALRDTLREISGPRRLTIYYDTYKRYFM